MIKKTVIFMAAFYGVSLAYAAGGRGGGNNDMRANADISKSKAAAVSATAYKNTSKSESVFKRKEVKVPSPYRFEKPKDVVTDNRRPAEPKNFENGKPIKQKRETKPPSQHTTVVRDKEFIKRIENETRTETRRGRYYWHTDNSGRRYTHFIDNRNTHWYGFYHGPRFYWTRRYADHWWWYDGAFARWVFWWNGFWWWWGPGGIAFVYVDNSYYPYDMATRKVIVQKTEIITPPDAAPPVGNEKKWMDKDKTRIAQIYGDNSEGFLYDNSGQQPVYIAYLGRDIAKVRFSKDTSVQILVDFKDGTFALYDINGNPQKLETDVPSFDIPQPPVPESVPAPPAAVPEQ